MGLNVGDMLPDDTRSMLSATPITAPSAPAATGPTAYKVGDALPDDPTATPAAPPPPPQPAYTEQQRSYDYHYNELKRVGIPDARAQKIATQLSQQPLSGLDRFDAARQTFMKNLERPGFGIGSGLEALFPGLKGSPEAQRMQADNPLSADIGSIASGVLETGGIGGAVREGEAKGAASIWDEFAKRYGVTERVDGVITPMGIDAALKRLGTSAVTESIKSKAPQVAASLLKNPWFWSSVTGGLPGIYGIYHAVKALGHLSDLMGE